ncbi:MULTISPECIES: HigA family addiction module antitoxin [Halomonadaceae]|uniref:HigA family addiction module antitoxin n=1 Tax=Halomonadaceae TaxID=28256 RepID=UPI0015837924|nr:MULTISPECIES: HigA family addiction module antitoxin [Halomonas]NUJ61163.1 HigA family addiction module antidote protein [Halomonas taeanensis]
MPSRHCSGTLACHKRAVTADTALMLSRVFGNTVQFWLGLQQKVDIWEATQDAYRSSPRWG